MQHRSEILDGIKELRRKLVYEITDNLDKTIYREILRNVRDTIPIEDLIFSSRFERRVLLTEDIRSQFDGRILQFEEHDFENPDFCLQLKDLIVQNRDLRRAVTTVQPPTDKDETIALDLQFQELEVAQAICDDEKAAVDLSKIESETERDYRIALGLAEEHHEADAELMTCTSCMSQFSEDQGFEAPCGAHSYCHDCLKDLFEYTIKDESLYPPSCCKHEIDYDDVRIILDDKLIQRYNKKKLEYDTEPRKRTYCCGANCEAFVPETSIQGEVATCLDCGRRTCTI
ncbi:hypothetical protein KCU65_g4092, partial [Aureobasidium melanogenum]